MRWNPDVLDKVDELVKDGLARSRQAALEEAALEFVKKKRKQQAREARLPKQTEDC
jgi:hypothetical protein